MTKLKTNQTFIKWIKKQKSKEQGLKHQKQRVPTFTSWERREKIKKKNDQREQIDSSASDTCYTRRKRTQQHFQIHDK